MKYFKRKSAGAPPGNGKSRKVRKNSPYSFQKKPHFRAVFFAVYALFDAGRSDSMHVVFDKRRVVIGG